mgnify:CR=1 FL=1
MIAIAQEELSQHETEIREVEAKIIEATVERDPKETRDDYMEIRAGTSGEQAAIYARDIFKIYSKTRNPQGKALVQSILKQ